MKTTLPVPVSEAPRPEGRSFPVRCFSLIGCPFLPAGRQGPALKGGACGALAGQEPVDYWKVFCSKAFKVVQGMDYNKIASEMRDNAEGTTPFFYEVECKEDQPWRDFKDRVYPSFVRYLNYKSLDPGVGQGLIVSLYYKERFYLLVSP